MGFHLNRDLWRPVKRTFKKPSTILRPLARKVTQPHRELSEDLAELGAMQLSAMTTPYLEPISKIMEALAINIDVGLPNPEIKLSGGTEHRLLVPGWNSPMRMDNALSKSDFTGGILSDMAFRLDNYRAIRNDLEFLHKTMRKGLYPHKDDLFELEILIQPNLGSPGKHQHFLQTEVTVNDTTRSIIVMDLRPGQVEARKEGNPVWKETLVLPLPNCKIHQIDLKTAFVQSNGALETMGDHVAETAEALELRINRINDDLNETLHRFSITHPHRGDYFTSFKIDRRGWGTPESEDCKQFAGSFQADGGALKSAADDLEKAVKMIDNFPVSPDIALPSPAQMDVALGYLVQRVSAMETIKALIFRARSGLKAFRPEQGRFDYRLRYKVRIENPTNIGERDLKVSMGYESFEDPRVPLGFEIPNLHLPEESVYETTVYPLKCSADMKSVFKVESDKSVDSLCPVTLTTSYGEGETLIDAKMLAPESTTGSKPATFDMARIEWEIKDMAKNQ